MSRRRDEGLTLIELLIVVVILGVVFGAITMAIITGMKTTVATDQRLSLSHDAEIASTWFTTDAQSATTVRTDATHPVGAPITCGPAPTVRMTASNDGLVARLDWTEGDGTVFKVVSYVLSTPSGSERTLIRYACSGSTTPDNVRDVAHFVGPTLAVACPTSADDDAACAAPWTNRQAKLTVSACARDDLNVCIADSAYSFMLRGSRRAG